MLAGPHEDGEEGGIEQDGHEHAGHPRGARRVQEQTAAVDRGEHGRERVHLPVLLVHDLEDRRGPWPKPNNERRKGQGARARQRAGTRAGARARAGRGKERD